MRVTVCLKFNENEDIKSCVYSSAFIALWDGDYPYLEKQRLDGSEKELVEWDPIKVSPKKGQKQDRTLDPKEWYITDQISFKEKNHFVDKNNSTFKFKIHDHLESSGRSISIPMKKLAETDTNVYGPYDGLWLEVKTKEDDEERVTINYIRFAISKKTTTPIRTKNGPKMLTHFYPKRDDDDVSKKLFIDGTVQKNINSCCCYVCEKVSEDIPTCTCGSISYCGRKCQEKDWSRHYKECSSSARF